LYNINDSDLIKEKSGKFQFVKPLRCRKFKFNNLLQLTQITQCQHLDIDCRSVGHREHFSVGHCKHFSVGLINIFDRYVPLRTGAYVLWC